MKLFVKNIVLGLMLVPLLSHSGEKFKMISPSPKELWIYPVCDVFHELLPSVSYMYFPGGELGDESGIKWIPSIPVSKDQYLGWIDRYQKKKIEDRVKKMPEGWLPENYFEHHYQEWRDKALSSNISIVLYQPFDIDEDGINDRIIGLHKYSNGSVVTSHLFRVQRGEKLVDPVDDFDLVWEQAGFPFYHDNYVYTYSGGEDGAMIHSPTTKLRNRNIKVVKSFNVCHFIKE